MKFNKILRGIKDKKYKKRNQKKIERGGHELQKMEKVEQKSSSEEAASETSEQKKEARLTRQREKAELRQLEEPMTQQLEVEGGSASDG